MLTRLWGHISYFFTDFSLYLVILFITTLAAVYFIHKIYKSKATENRKKILLVCIFTIVSIVYIYSGFEAYFRYRYDETDGLGFLQTNQRWMGRYVQYNNIIYRDNEDYLPVKQPGTVNIGVIGDSLTFGWGIKNVDDRFSNLLEAKLNQNGYKVEVYNFGIPGQNTCNEISQFKSIDYIPMDIIIWEYYFNGVEPCDQRNAGNKILQEAEASMNPVRVFLSKESFFFDFLYWRFTSTHDTIYRALRSADLAQYSNPGVFKDHVKDIATISAELKFAGNTGGVPRKVVAILFPLLNLWTPAYYPGTKIEGIIANIIASRDIKVIDMLPSYQGKTTAELTVDRFDAHPNEYVNRLAADKLYDAIVPMLQKNGKTTTVKQ